MGERLLCKQEVIGSNPFTSTTGVTRRAARLLRCDWAAVGRGAMLGEDRRTPPGRPGGVAD